MNTPRTLRSDERYAIVADQPETNATLYLKYNVQDWTWSWVTDFRDAFYMTREVAGKVLQDMSDTWPLACKSLNEGLGRLSIENPFGLPEGHGNKSLYDLVSLDDTGTWIIQIEGVFVRPANRVPIPTEGSVFVLSTNYLKLAKKRVNAWLAQLEEQIAEINRTHRSQLSPALSEKLDAMGFSSGWDLVLSYRTLVGNRYNWSPLEYTELISWLSSTGLLYMALKYEKAFSYIRAQ